MIISDKEFDKLLKISKISPKNQEHEKKVKDHINLIVKWASEIKSINTDGIDPLVNIISDFSENIDLNQDVKLSLCDVEKIKESLKINQIQDEDYFLAPTKVV